MKKTLLLVALVVTLGTGCTDRFKTSAPREPVAIQRAFESSTTTFGNAEPALSGAEGTTVSAASSTTPLVRWDTTSIPWARVTFTPPAKTWVYSADGSRAFQLVPGSAPAPGSPDPKIDVFTRRVAEFNAADRDTVSFPTWERFELTMAQFACASGDTDETFTTCTDKASNVYRGKTAVGLPYTKFTLPSYRKKDKAFMGNHTYFMVRLGAASDHGILVAVLNEKTGVTPAWSLVKSMRIE